MASLSYVNVFAKDIEALRGFYRSVFGFADIDVDTIMAERTAIIGGKQVYAGPLSDRDGILRVPAGQVLSDADLWKMDWFVKGVIAQK